MKKIKITAEWVLEHYSASVTVDKDGEVLLSTDTIESACWIELALNNLGIKYFISEYERDENEPICTFWSEYTFRLDDIKQDCPNVYSRWYQLYLSNSSRNSIFDNLN